MLSHLKRARRQHGYDWCTFGYEILSSMKPVDYRLVGEEMVLRHNSKNVFRTTIQEDSCVMALLKELEGQGKAVGNKHVSGFCCVAERTKIGSKGTVRCFVEANLTKLLRGMARGIIARVDGFCVEEQGRKDDRVARQEETPDVIMFEPGDPPVDPPDTTYPLLRPINPSDPACTWPLVIYGGQTQGVETNREWLNFLLMCQCIANTLGVSHQEAVYHNCIKMEMARRNVPHISHFHCVQRLPGGEMAKIGELDLLVELATGNYLVELKVCAQWRRFENQIKKYINAVHSMGYRAAGAAIVNFNPKGVIEVAMFDAASRHAPSPSL